MSRKILSYLMIACGLVLLFSGARDLFESRQGQSDIAHDFAPQAAEPPLAKPAALRQPQLGEAVAKLAIPRLNTQLYVVEGDGATELRRGPGHLVGTAMPGGRGNCVIAGHRDTHFRVLKDIRKGDLIVLETPGGHYFYRVQLTSVVSPENISALQPTTDPQLHLITCFPFYYVGPAPRRFVVQAELTSAPPAPASAPARVAARSAPILTQLTSKPARPVRQNPRRSFAVNIRTTHGGHRKMGGWNRVPKSSTASRNYRPTSSP